MRTILCGDRYFRQIEAIIFDKDGTLENSQNYLRELAVKRARLIDAQVPGIGEPLLMALGIQDDRLDPTGLMAVGSCQENLIAAAAYIAETGCSWFESLAIAKNSFIEADKYLQRNPQTSPLFTGCLEVLKKLADAGVKLGILSSDSTVNVETFVSSYQLQDYIQLSMGAERDICKPEPELFIQACQRLGVKPENTLMVGDARGDMDMAKNAGAAGTIFICWHAPRASYLELEADAAITQLDEILIAS